MVSTQKRPDLLISIRNIVQRFSQRYISLVTPINKGIPRTLTLYVYPIFLFAALVTLTIFNISGTSSGMHMLNLGVSEDPNLLSGVPRAIRSDEWLVQQSWVISQFNQGFPAINNSFMGGIDSTFLNELPVWDWTVIFRPQVWVYLFFGINAGIAWFWWFPLFTLALGAYLFVLSIFPARLITAVLLSASICFTPFVQWWFGPVTLNSLGWPLFVLAVIGFTLGNISSRARWLLASISGYFAVTLAMGGYLPFIVPGALLILFFLLGSVFNEIKYKSKFRHTLLKLIPLATACVSTLFLLLVWVVTKQQTINLILNTSYPGHRTNFAGSQLIADKTLGQLFGGIWNRSLMYVADGTGLGPNQSEAAGALIAGLGCLFALLVLSIYLIHKKLPLDWSILFTLFWIILIVAYMYVPGWDFLSRIFGLNFAPAERLKIAIVLTVVVGPVLLMKAVSQYGDKALTILRISLLFYAALIFWGYGAAVYIASEPLRPFVLSAIVVALLLTLGLWFIASKKTYGLGTALFLVSGIIVSWGVNPVYSGAVNLADSQLGNKISQINNAQDGNWLSVGNTEAMATLIETGVSTYSGIQPFPAVEMWNLIDPEDSYKKIWNRLAHIHWNIHLGELQMFNPQPDVIEINFDPCGAFAQENLNYVIASSILNSNCLSQISSVKEGQTDFIIYRVVLDRIN